MPLSSFSCFLLNTELYKFELFRRVGVSSPEPLKTRQIWGLVHVNIKVQSGSLEMECFSGIFDVKDAPRTGGPVVENFDKVTEIIEVDRLRRSSSNGGQTRTKGQEGSTVYLVGLERNHLLGDASAWPNTKFRSLLSTTGPFEASDGPEMANRRGVAFHRDNAWPHTSVVTRQSLCELGYEVLMHLPYSPDLAPSDSHLFLKLQSFLSDKKLGSIEDC
ncbi:histone-lysine N-methyltransferase SETMAR [Trichonephila clavipes]|nr:histone-lysine N-methyltransferase SETMAR [Trichonephila clavipes]